MGVGILGVKAEGKRSFQDVGVDGRVILKWPPKKWDGCGLR